MKYPETFVPGGVHSAAGQVHKDDPRAHRRTGPIEEYYRGLKKEEEPACLADYAGEIDAVLKAEEEEYRARRHAEWRLRLAGQFMAADINTSPPDRKYDVISGAKWSLDAADALLARWKETTPEVKPVVEEVSPESFGKAFEAAGIPAGSEGGEA